MRSKPVKTYNKKLIDNPRIQRKKLEKDLDKVFSHYIRQRGAFEYGGELYNTCVTCGVELPLKELQCGHYYSRGVKSLRWNEDNCHVQCSQCNVTKHGNYPKYVKYLTDNFGHDFVANLDFKASVPVRYTLFDIKNMLKYYSSKLKV